MKKKAYEIGLEIVTIVAFIALSFFVCRYHEYWADEAHAWLFARDCTIRELLTKYLHSDGHPILWHSIIKLFQSFGLKYDYFYLISILFSSLGVVVFVTKSKFPIYIRMLMPFTYFIFFQYTVIVRGYCLLFFILSLIAAMYEKRHSNIFLYTLLLMILLSTEAYTYIFAGMLYVKYMYEFIKEKNSYSKKDIRKHYGSFIILFIAFGLTALYVYPYSTNTFDPGTIGYFPSTSFFYTFPTFYDLKEIILGAITTVILVTIIFLGYKNYLKKLGEFAFLLLPVMAFYIIKYHNCWHLGIVLLLSIFIFWIQKLEKNKWILFLLSIVIVIQGYWSICSIKYEINNSYSGAREAADFIKEYDYENMSIFGLEFYCSALNPYFEKNIYNNWVDDKGFFYWDESSKYYDIDDFEEYIKDNNYDMVVIAPKDSFKTYDELLDKYDYYDFFGHTFVENFKYEDQSYRVLVRKDIEKR